MSPRGSQQRAGSAVLGHLRAPEDDVEEPEPGRERVGGNWPARLLWWSGATLTCLGLAASGFAIGGLAAWLQSVPPLPEMERYDPPEMTVLVDRAGVPYAQLFEQRRRFVSLAEMPPMLPEAFMAIEDTRFRDHVGINPLAIVRAALLNAQRGTMSQGASTITQQLPRNLATTIGREKTLERKVREALVALQLERHYSKDQILETYLNQIYLGSGNYGVEAAARRYFGKTVAELDLAECALLAGLPQLPERYSPLNDPEAALRRRNQVLDRLLSLGWIEPTEYDVAFAMELHVVDGDRVASGPTDWFVDVVRRDIERVPELAMARLRAEGWVVETTLDTGLQLLAAEVLREGLVAEEALWLEDRPRRFARAQAMPEFTRAARAGQVRMARVVRRFERTIVVELGDGSRADLEVPAEAPHLFDLAVGDGVDVEVDALVPGRAGLWRGHLLPRTPLQGALVCLDRRTGEVLALVGGRPDEAGRRRDFFNRALAARRQAGSTIKPHFFAALLHAGYTPDSVFVDEPVTYAGGYAPQNFERRFFGPTTLQEALEHSRNVPTIRAVRAAGFSESLAFVDRFAITRPERGWEFRRELPVVLGAAEITPFEAAASYLPFANAGVATPPGALREIRHNSGRVLHRPAPRARRILDADETAGMVQMLVGVMTHGTGRSLQGELPADWHGRLAGKSGTTSDYRDAWFAGFTTDHVVAVWVGFDQPLPLGEGRGGGRVAGPIWTQFLARVSERRGVGPGDLELPAGWRLVPVHAASGRMLDDAEEQPTGAATRWVARHQSADPPAGLAQQAVPMGE
ncbi:MAG: PBP1A family penicillin-binding protein [Candidatus Sumerlaeia bacterium]|nr:PBP1A family penicillin-binding protein [Candidatus Sumerlaeia bacterium]